MAHVDLLLTVHQLGSATQAAAALSLSTATVMRRIGATEESLGVRLFERTPSGLLPTKALARILPWVETIQSSGTSLLREVSGLESSPTGSVRISLLETTATWIVAPKLPGLLERYPGLEVSLLPGAEIVDMVKGGADIALRTFRPASGDLISRKLTEFPMVIAASPELLARLRPKNLSELPWIDWDESAPQTPDVTWVTRNVPGARTVLRSSSVSTMLHAAQAGVGAVVTAAPLVAAVGGLAQIALTAPSLPTMSLYMVVHSAQRHVPRVAVVWEFLLVAFEEAMATAAYRLASPLTPGTSRS